MIFNTFRPYWLKSRRIWIDLGILVGEQRKALSCTGVAAEWYYLKNSSLSGLAAVAGTQCSKDIVVET